MSMAIRNSPVISTHVVLYRKIKLRATLIEPTTGIPDTHLYLLWISLYKGCLIKDR